jgi:hypothetical protein
VTEIFIKLGDTGTMRYYDFFIEIDRVFWKEMGTRGEEKPCKREDRWREKKKLNLLSTYFQHLPGRLASSSEVSSTNREGSFSLLVKFSILAANESFC